MSHVETYLSAFVPQIKQFDQIITDHTTFLIIGHSHPDGDCLWSMLWLGRRLEKQGKKVQYTASRSHASSLDRVWWSEKISYFVDNSDYERYESEVVILIDHSSYGQRSDAQLYFLEHITGDQTIVCIDHHLDANVQTHCSLIDESSSSACELVRELLDYLDPTHTFVDDTIASCCFLWLITDTGASSWFVREKDSIRTFENALGMIKAGAQKSMIIEKLNRFPLNQLLFTKMMFDRMQSFDHGVRVCIEEKDRLSYGLDQDASSQIQSLMSSVEDLDIIVVCKIVDGSLHGSLRTTNDINVQSIAKQFGWWGHRLAAWFRLNDRQYTLDDIKQTIIPTINARFTQQHNQPS